MKILSRDLETGRTDNISNSCYVKAKPDESDEKLGCDYLIVSFRDEKGNWHEYHAKEVSIR